MPFRTAVSFWGQSAQFLRSLSPNQDCGSERVKVMIEGFLTPEKLLRNRGCRQISHFQAVWDQTYRTYRRFYMHILYICEMRRARTKIHPRSRRYMRMCVANWAKKSPKEVKQRSYTSVFTFTCLTRLTNNFYLLLIL